MVDITKSLTSVNPINPDDVKNSKRRTINFLPAIFQTDVLKKIFSASVDHLYQPQDTEELVGYIGEVTSFYNKIRDFYVPEKNDLRTEYQLTPVMVSKQLENNNLLSSLYYQDLINYVRFKGGITNDHNRLFEQNYYSWCPPIDLDKFMNYRDYYWIAESSSPLITNSYTNLSSLVGNKTGSININGTEVTLSSGMKILPTNDSNDFYTNKEWIVEGVGRSIFFILGEIATGGWDIAEWDLSLWDEAGDNFLTPNYITMERGCRDNNTWSRTNRWFHRDVINDFYNESITKIQASRPIIEFEKDLELWNYGFYDRGKVDLVITNCPNFYGIVQGLSNGWDDSSWDPIQDFGGSESPKKPSRIFGYENVEVYNTTGNPYLNVFTSQNHSISFVGPNNTQLNNIIKLGIFELNPALPIEEASLSFSNSSLNEIIYVEYVDNEGLVLFCNATKAAESGLDISNPTQYTLTIKTTTDFYIEEFNEGYFTIFTAQGNITLNQNYELENLNDITVNNTNYKIFDHISSNTNNIPNLSCGITLSRPRIESGVEIYKSWDVQWPLSDLGYSEIYVKDEFGSLVQLRDGMRILLKDDADPGADNKLVEVNGIAINGRITLQFINNGLDALGNPMYGERVTLKTPAGKIRNYWFNGEDWEIGQTKELPNQAPKFTLYDIHGNRLNDEGVFPGSTFNSLEGNEIFSYKIDTDSGTPIDPILGFRIERNQFDEIVFVNNLSTEIYSYTNVTNNNSLPIKGYYFYKIGYDDNIIFSNGWHMVPEKTNQYYIQTINTLADVTSYDLDVLPNVPYFNRDSSQKESIIVRLDGKELVLDTDYAINVMVKTITLNMSIEKDQILKIYSLTDNIVNEGRYSVPLNLEANATNEEVKEVGFNQLFEHFYSNIGGQLELEGSQYNRNNYRDTKKSRYFGGKILQHSAPMLLPMLLASKSDLDIVDSIKYNQREYVRFKNKFIQKITQYLENRTLSPLETNIVGGVPETTGNTPEEWINLAIKEINVAKTIDFPFKNTGMGGANTINPERLFIPPTPAFLGLTGVYTPEIVTDNTFDEAVQFIQGHDGSLTPSFDDFRDDVILAFEQKIFNSIPEKFKTEKLPLTTKFDILPGKFRNSKYSKEEILQVSKPAFEIWSSQAGVDYTANTEEYTSNQFGLNYSAVKDIYGENIPGNWRGIYTWYFDTDRPHTHPWEMLGFTIKPDWWDYEYGVAPYTSGNTKLWTDLERGLIRDGVRAGIDERFARPGLLKIIPVSTTGELLPPYSAKIIKRLPQESESLLPWKFGDYSPIETAWRKSEFFAYDLIQTLYLLNPSKIIAFGWDTLQIEEIKLNENSDTQIVYSSYGKRPLFKELIVHDETIEVKERYTDVDLINSSGLIRNFGIQQFISNFLESQGKNITTLFGDLVRGLGVQLGYKAAGFIDQQTTRLDSDSFGRVPVENIDITLYKSNSIREIFYGGIIIEKTGKGFKVYGYDLVDPVFKIIPSDEYGRKTTVGIGNKGNPFDIWQANKQYTRTDIVFYEDNNQYYRCIEDHISTNSIDADKWFRIANPPTQYQIQVIKYLDPVVDQRVERIPYGTEYQTVQEVFNLLINYERFLVKEGFIFDRYSDEVNDVIDWTWSGKEFLSWVAGGPEELDIIALSPSTQQLRFKTDFGNIEPIEQIVQGVYSILNRDGVKIDPSATAVSRFDGLLELIPINIQNPNNLIYATRLFITELEHSILLDNKTIFNDIVYDPLFNIRQKRLRLSTVRSRNWRGRYDAPGFIITDNQLLPNYDKLSDQFRYIFDINKDYLVEKDWRSYGYHNIGYQNREYLDQLIISEKSQFNFYQGMIREKGTRSSFDRLLRSEFITRTSDLFFYEEWAFRVGHYGDWDRKPGLEVLFNQENYKQNPQQIDFDLVDIPHSVQKGTSLPLKPEDDKKYFLNTTNGELYKWDINQYTVLPNWDSVFDEEFKDNPYDDIVNIYTIKDNNQIIAGDNKWIRRPDTTVSNLTTWVWGKRKSEYGNTKDLPNAGYAKLDEAEYYAFNATSFLNLFSQERSNGRYFADGERVWVYDTAGLYNYYLPNEHFTPPIPRGITKYPNSWSMFRISEVKNINLDNLLISEDEEEIIITFNTDVAYFNYDGSDNDYQSPVSISADKIIFNGSIPTPGVISNTVTSNSLSVLNSQLYEVSSITVTTVETIISAIPISASPLSSLSTTNMPVFTSSTSFSSDQKVYITSSSMVTVTTNTKINKNIQTSATGVSANFISISDQIDTECDFKPAFSSNIFITGTAPVESPNIIVSANNNIIIDEAPAPGVNAFNIFDVNDVITLQVNNGSEYDFEGTYIVKKIISSNQIVVERPNSFTKDFDAEELGIIRDNTQIFTYRECKFRNTEEFNNIINSINYSGSFFNPFNDEIFYVDDARTEAEKTILEPYYEVYKSVDWATKEFDLERKQENKVDTINLYNATIYNKETGIGITEAAIYDPYKGIIPGVAEKEIWYKLDFDPAKYNQGDGLFHNINSENAWGLDQVGRVWWDLSTLRYLDYEIGSNRYRRDNWGKFAPGSNIDVYEWVRSSVPPANYQIQAIAAENIPGKMKDDTPSGQIYKPESPAYCQHQEYDNKTGKLKNYYYFWVRNKITLPNVGFRSISVNSVANIIKDPTAAGIRWAAPININSCLVSNLYEYLGDTNAVLQFNWVTKDKNSNWHKQWVLGREGDSGWLPDEIVYNKMIDSLVGYDTNNYVVPDPSLNTIERSGIFVRPRQTMFVDQVKARSNYIEFFNQLLEKNNYNNRLNALNNILIEDTPSTSTNHIVDNFIQRDFIAETNVVGINQTVLVNKNPEMNDFWSIWKLTSKSPISWELVEAQKYKTEDFITISDWYGEGADKNSPPLKVFSDEVDRNNAVLDGLIIDGDIIIVEDVNSSGLWEWQEYIDGNFNTIAKKSSTISLSYNFINNNTVYGINENWGSLTKEDLLNKIKNRDGSLELRKLLETFRYEENTLTIKEVNKTFFNMIKYAFSENQIIDWAFKSSYILFGGTVEALEQEEIIRPTLFDSLIDYISEVKPYHVKFREFARRIATAVDTYNVTVTDFDMPLYFDRNTLSYRKLDINNSDDLSIIQNNKPWSDWYENYVVNPQLIRNFKITEKFDRVSCSPADNEPNTIKIFSDGESSSYCIEVNNFSVITEPAEINYQVFKGPSNPPKISSPQLWNRDNIEMIEIKDNISDSAIVLNESQWDIVKEEYDYTLTNDDIGKFLITVEEDGDYYGFKYISDSNISHKLKTEKERNEIKISAISNIHINNTVVKKGRLRISIDIIPKLGDIIEINRKLHTADRINRYYSPITNLWHGGEVSHIIPEKYSKGLISGCEFLGTINEGGSYSHDEIEIVDVLNSSTTNLIYDVIVSGIATRVSGTSWNSISSPLDASLTGRKFIQPEMGGNRPEEQVLCRIPDSLLMDIYSQDTAGAPKVYQYKEISSFRLGDIRKLPGLAQSRESIFVFVNERLLTENIEYSVDWNAQTIRFRTTFNNQKSSLVINCYSTGGDSILYTRFIRSFQSLSDNEFELYLDKELKENINPINLDNMFITYNGYIVSPISLSITNQNSILKVDLSNIDINEDYTLIVTIFKSNNIAVIRREYITITSGVSTYPINYISGPEEPIEQSTLIFINGNRVLGPIFKYFKTDGIQDYYDTGLILSEYNNIDVFLNSVKIPTSGAILISGDSTQYTWTFVEDESNFIKFNKIPNENNDIIVAIKDTSVFEFTEDRTAISLNQTYLKNSNLSIITFNDNRSMQIKTEFFKGRSDSKYPLAFKPYTQHNIWASVSGKSNTFSTDYILILGTKKDELYIFNSSKQIFVSSLVNWNNHPDNILLSKEIKFKDSHLIEYDTTTILDYSTVGFDNYSWDFPTDTHPGWDITNPKEILLSNSPGFDNETENSFDEDTFDSEVRSIKQDDVYITYMTGEEKQDATAFRAFTPWNGDKEYLRIANSHKMFLKTEISANSNSFEIYENINILPALVAKTPLMTPNIAKNIPGYIWVNGEKIKYWDLSIPTEISGKRFWTVSRIERGISKTAEGIKALEEYELFAADGSSISFEVDGLGNQDFNISIINYVQHNGVVERGQDIPLNISTKNVKGDFTVSGDRIIFNNIPSIDPLYTVTNTPVSGSSVIYLKNILINKKISNWENESRSHPAGSLVINGNVDQRIPGGFDHLYNNNITGILGGLQNQDTIQTEFLKNKPGGVKNS